MKFVIPFFNHQNGNVRDIASSLVAEVSVKVGFYNEELNDYIKDLNPQILNIIKMKSAQLKKKRNYNNNNNNNDNNINKSNNNNSYNNKNSKNGIYKFNIYIYIFTYINKI